MDIRQLNNCSGLLNSIRSGMAESPSGSHRVVLWSDPKVSLQDHMGDSNRRYVESICDLDSVIIDADSIDDCDTQAYFLQQNGYLERDFHDQVLLITAKLHDQIDELTADLTISRQVLQTVEEFQSLKTMWEQNHVDPMNSFAWNFSWWNAFASSGKLRILKFERNGATIGFAPFYIDRWFGLKRFRFLATGDTCTDYVDIVCDPKYYELCAFSLAEYVREQRFDTVELECSKNDRLSKLMTEHLDSTYHFDHREVEPTWRLALPDAWPEFKANAKKSLRRKINRAERNLNSNELELTSTTAGVPVEQAFEILTDLHTKRWSSLGKKGVFANPQFEAFLRSAVHELSRQGKCEISIVSKSGQPIGAQLYFVSREGFQLYQSGYCPESMKLEPGHILFTDMVKRAINRGDKHFDFLRGDEPYKSFWGAAPHSQKKLRMVCNRPFPFGVASLVIAMRRLLRREVNPTHDRQQLRQRFSTYDHLFKRRFQSISIPSAQPPRSSQH